MTGVQTCALPISGTLTGFKDSTMLKINPYLTNTNIDLENESHVYLKNGKFTLKGNLVGPTKYFLRVSVTNARDFEFMNFWAENNPMTLNGKKGLLLFSEVHGSKIQDQYEELISITRELEIINKQIKDSVISNPEMEEEVKSSLRKIYYPNLELIQTRTLEFIYSHPTYFVAVAELARHVNLLMPSDQIDKKKISDFYDRLDEPFKKNIYGVQLKNFIDQLSSSVSRPELKVGDKPYTFSLPDQMESTVDLASFKGKVVLLDFWASGCGPCRLEHKNYLKAYKTFKAKGFEIISVSQDQSKKHWLKAMEEDSMIWKSVWDKSRDVTRNLYEVRAIPTNYLISAEGNIISIDLRGEELDKKLNIIFN